MTAYVPDEPIDFRMTQRRATPSDTQTLEPGMVRMIDPPSGWQYGFPREFPEGVTDLSRWLFENGYPRRIIEDFGGEVPCRFWTQPANPEPTP